MAEWTEPKTDWTTEDAFDYVSYNRVTGNILFLKQYADKLFGNVTDFPIETGKENISLIYARHMNDIEEGLEKLNIQTYGFDVGDKKTYKANGNVPDSTEYNRIESACLKLYNEMKVHEANLYKLDFTLGNQKGFRV